MTAGLAEEPRRTRNAPIPYAPDDEPEVDGRILKFHLHQSLESKCIRRGSPYRLVVCIGGIRSGKSLVVARWLIDRGQWDTAQMQCIVANTKGQLDTILQDVMPWVEAAGIEWQAHRQPPPEWIAKWRLRGTPVPPRRMSYRGILILSNGLHVQLASLENNSFKRIKGARWGSVVIEEVCAGATEDALRYIFERVNCNLGPKRCRELHHHVKILHSNPPDDDSHFIFDWLLRYERAGAKKSGFVRPTGEAFSEESYYCLKHGLGDAIYIVSRTSDNSEHLPEEFIDDLAAGIDDDTAAKIFDGALRRSQKGRVYNAFSHENQIDTNPYDPDRTIYVAVDFNKNPAVALLAHPLKHGEYPTEYERDGLSHVGVFGEVFHIGGADVAMLCTMLLTGQAGSDGALPSNFKGLKDHRGKIIFYGDATSNYETMAPKEWAIVDEVMRGAIRGKYTLATDTKQNPLQPLGAHAVNARFRNAKGERSLWIHQRCARLIRDMLVNEWHKTDPGKIYKPGPRGGGDAWTTTHLGDALRYLISALFPLGREVSVKAEDYIPRAGGSSLKIPRVTGV